MNIRPSSKALAFILASATTLFYTASAQEVVSLEEAQKGARLVTQSAGSISDAPFKMEINTDKPQALKVGSVGILAIPSTGLIDDAMAKVGKDVLPLGQLWMLSIAPATGGKVLPSSRLRMITVTDKDKDARVSMFFLGARKNDKDAIELVLYGKDKEPVMHVPLEKIDGSQDVPIELAGRKEGDDSGLLTLKFLGKFKADITVMKQED
jgi:hypothetical protein